jgi:predicted transcriptional regulator
MVEMLRRNKDHFISGHVKVFMKKLEIKFAIEKYKRVSTELQRSNKRQRE